VLSFEPLEVGCIVKVRAIGALIIEDEEGVDAKILSVLVNDARFEGYNDIADAHPHQLKEIQEFFETCKTFGTTQMGENQGMEKCGRSSQNSDSRYGEI